MKKSPEAFLQPMRIATALLMTSLSLPTWAEQRTTDELIAAARTALAERHIIASPKCAPGESSDGMQILYELGNVAVVGFPKGGFAVIAKGTEHETLWGYSSAPFDAENPAPGFLALLQEINDCMAKADAQSTSSAMRRVLDRDGLPERVEPLITTQWNQGAPYNNLTPTIDGKHCRTGCSVTVLSQIFNYYRRPTHLDGMGKASTWHWPDDSRGEPFEADRTPLTWDFDQMVSNYEQEEYTEQQASSVANLMYACGLTIGVAYGLKGTAGNWSDIEKFNYKTKYGSSLRNLAEGDPILYAAVDHGMIIDGYDEDGFLHFNFGWGGLYDGYYATDNKVFKYAFSEDYDYIPGEVVTYCDKAICENGEYYINPRKHKALFDKPLKKDNDHLCETDVFFPSTFNIEGEDYTVEFAAGITAFDYTDANSFTFDEGITTIPSKLAMNCKHVQEVHLPCTTQHVSDYAFYTSSIKDIYCAATVPPTLGNYALPPGQYGQYVLTLHVPAEAIDAYKEHPTWMKANIVALDESMSIIAPKNNESNAATYDISGRSATNTNTHGTYIVNGRKVLR